MINKTGLLTVGGMMWRWDYKGARTVRGWGWVLRKRGGESVKMYDAGQYYSCVTLDSAAKKYAVETRA